MGLLAAADALGWFGRHFHVFLPLAPGLFAVWGLLPKGRRQPLFVPVVAGVLFLLLAWPCWIHGTESALHQALFVVFSVVTIVAAAGMIAQSNPVYAALLFAMVILGTVGLFFLLAAPFLGAATVIVYAGAIVVMFLFVIMLAQQSGMASYDRHSEAPLGAALVGMVLLAGLIYAFEKSYASAEEQTELKEQTRALEDVMVRLAEIERHLSDLTRLEAAPEPTASGEVLRGAREKLAAAEEARGALVRLEKALGALESGVKEGRVDERLRELRSSVGQVSLALERTSRQGFLAERADEPKPEWSTAGAGHDQVAGLGRSLFGQYLWAIELAGTLLMVAIIGAILIAPERMGVRP